MSKEKSLEKSNKRQIASKLKEKQKLWRHKLVEISDEQIDWNKKPRTVLLLIDCSSSMNIGDKFQKAKNGSISFSSEALNKSYFVGLIKFESYGELLLEPQSELTLIKNKIEELYIGGSTNLSNALQIARNNLKNKIGEKVICIYTDGMPDDRESCLILAEELKKESIDIMAIGTDDADYKFLKKLSSRVDLSVKVNSEQLEKAFLSMAKMLPGK